MRITRLVYWVMIVINTALNGLALAHLLGATEIFPGIVPAALIFNIVLLPVAVATAYRTGEIAEEAYRRNVAAPADPVPGNEPAQGEP